MIPTLGLGWIVDGKARFIFPVLATGVIVFFVSAIVTFANIGFHTDFVSRWLRAFIIGWPAGAVLGFFALPRVRMLTLHIVARIEGKRTDV